MNIRHNFTTLFFLFCTIKNGNTFVYRVEMLRIDCPVATFDETLQPSISRIREKR